MPTTFAQAGTSTHLPLYRLPDKSALVDQFVGQPLSALRSPALIVDRSVFRTNCETITGEAKRRGMKFRAHVKTHKTLEGTRMQVEAAGGVSAVICSTMIEVWSVIESGLVEDGLVNDILFSMPIGADKIPDIDAAQKRIGDRGVVRLMVDHQAQIELLDEYSERTGRAMRWDVFVKVDGGGKRAGAPPSSQQMKDLIQAILHSRHVGIFGFYSHFGQSYAAGSLSASSDYFAAEIACVQEAAKVALSLGAKKPRSSSGDEASWIFSVGATPTAHAAVQQVETLHGGLEGVLELHAGCYCMCDLQQHATSLITDASLALTVLARVVSVYRERGGVEALCDVGALAVSKDTGQYPGYGRVIRPESKNGWDLGRVSQEHGTLVKRQSRADHMTHEDDLEVGDLLRIVPQHACLACANFPWMYVVEDGGDTVVDVWVPWKGW
ncbi:hypothetical protein IAU60_003755 [Kwoniella sp. DSM 27419]